MDVIWLRTVKSMSRYTCTITRINSCNCTCISRHRLVIYMKIIIVRTYLHMIYQKYE